MEGCSDSATSINAVRGQRRTPPPSKVPEDFRPLADVSPDDVPLTRPAPQSDARPSRVFFSWMGRIVRAAQGVSGTGAHTVHAQCARTRRGRCRSLRTHSPATWPPASARVGVAAANLSFPVAPDRRREAGWFMRRLGKKNSPPPHGRALSLDRARKAQTAWNASRSPSSVAVFIAFRQHARRLFSSCRNP